MPVERTKDDKPFKKRGMRGELFLRALRREAKRKNILLYDVESKKGDSQEPGFDRPFLLGFDHGDVPGAAYTPFRNVPGLERLPWNERHIAEGGCVDLFCRFVFGFDFGPSARLRFQSERYLIGGHNAGRFDVLFVVPWLLDHRADFEMEIVTTASRVQTLDVWPRGRVKKKGFWRFVDTISLVPLSLKKMGKTFSPKEVKAFSDRDPAEIVEVFLCAECGHTEEAHLAGYCEHELERDPEPGMGVGPVLACGCRRFVRGPSRYEKMEFDLGTHESDPRWEIYNRQDCLVGRLGVSRFATLVQSLGGEVGITAPATAMQLFRRRFLPENVWIRRNAHFRGCSKTCRRDDCDLVLCGGECHGCLHDFVRRGYYGGRTELFRTWGRGLRYYDINSSYPASMLFPMPIGEVVAATSETTVDACRKLAKMERVGFVEAEVFIPKTCRVPPLPTRDPSTGKLVFPVSGKQNLYGVWDWAELETVFDNSVGGRIVRIVRSTWFESKPIFREMVSTLYAFREKHRDACEDVTCKGCNPEYDEGLAYVAKLLLNSLYGKFGMREERKALVVVDAGQMPEGMTPLYGDPLRDPIWEVDRLCSASYVIPQISAHITALSRVRLWKLMTWIVQNRGRLYYVDTDSIMTDIAIDPKFEHPSRLGAWKQEDPGALLDGEFILPKLYRLRAHELSCHDQACPGCKLEFHAPDCKTPGCKGCAVTKQKMKGLPHRYQTPENFETMVRGEDVEFERLTMMRTMLRASETGRVTGPRLQGPDEGARRGIRTRYDKRVLRPDGTTTPIVLGG